MISFNQVGFTYDGQTFALDDITFEVPQGAFVCVLGGNGSGKSTLAKHINALLIPDRGSVEVLDRSTAQDENLYFIRSNAGMVFQNPDDQIVASLVENDVAFGPENLGLPAEQLRERVTQALEQVGLEGFEKRETAQLSGGQKQRVAIAGVLAMEPQILVLDEASAMLDPRGRASLMRVCRELNEAGMTIVMITHFMEEAVAADTVYVLADGHIVASGSPREVLGNVDELEQRSLDVPFAAKMARTLQNAGMDIPFTLDEDELAQAIAQVVGRGSSEQLSADEDESSVVTDANVVSSTEASEEPSADAYTAPAAPTEELSKSDEALIVFDDVSYTYMPVSKKKKQDSTPTIKQDGWGNNPEQEWALEHIDFALHEGEFLGIAGHTGSGKSTLLQHMNGLLHPTQGQVRVHGYDIADKAHAALARKDVGLVFQYPEHQLFAATVFEDVAFGPRNLNLDEDEVRTRVEEGLRLVGLDADEIGQMSPFELSGGQQRRVAFAGVLAMRPRVLILDEPAAGLDPRSHAEFIQLVEDFHLKEHMTIVMASHNMDDLARLSDRILILNQGAQCMLGTPAEVFADAEVCRQVGLDVPSAQRLANTLRSYGVPLGEALYSQESLAHALQQMMV